MKVFALPQVTRLLRKERLPDPLLCDIAREIVAGRLRAGEADLGGGLWKKRLARPDEGRRGGFRAIVGYRQPRSDRVLFAYVFAKNAAATLTPAGQEALARTAETFIQASDAQVAALLRAEDVREVMCDGGQEQ